MTSPGHNPGEPPPEPRSDFGAIRNACGKQLSAYLSHRASNVRFMSDGGVWAQPVREGDNWFLDTTRDTLVFVPAFVAAFTLIPGGFFFALGGPITAVIVGGLGCISALAVMLSAVTKPEYRRQPVIRDGTWVWHGNTHPMSEHARYLILRVPAHPSAPGETYFEGYTCLIAITADGAPRLLSAGVGKPLINLLREAGYAVERHD